MQHDKNAHEHTVAGQITMNSNTTRLLFEQASKSHASCLTTNGPGTLNLMGLEHARDLPEEQRCTRTICWQRYQSTAVASCCVRYVR
jgi:hypothetical protein